MYGGSLNMPVHLPLPTTQASMCWLSAEGSANAPLIPVKCDTHLLHMHRTKAIYMHLRPKNVCQSTTCKARLWPGVSRAAAYIPAIRPPLVVGIFSLVPGVQRLCLSQVPSGLGAPVGANRGASGIDGVLSSAAGFAFGLNRGVTLVVGDISFLHDINGLCLLRSGRACALTISRRSLGQPISVDHPSVVPDIWMACSYKHAMIALQCQHGTLHASSLHSSYKLTQRLAIKAYCGPVVVYVSSSKSPPDHTDTERSTQVR